MNKEQIDFILNLFEKETSEDIKKEFIKIFSEIKFDTYKKRRNSKIF